MRPPRAGLAAAAAATAVLALVALVRVPPPATLHSDALHSETLTRAHDMGTCVADYAPCAGGLPSPVAKAHCCNPDFACFRRGPYFSQCRPRASAREVELPAHELCAPDYGVCSAGAASDSAIPCCNGPGFRCTLSSPFYHQCLPLAAVDPPATHSWFALPSGKAMFARGQDVHGLEVRPLAPAEKLDGVMRALAPGAAAAPSVLVAELPALHGEEGATFWQRLRLALPADVVFVDASVVAVLRVEETESLWDAAMVLAAFPEVRSVTAFGNLEDSRVGKETDPVVRRQDYRSVHVVGDKW